jgi:hypothetical protein
VANAGYRRFLAAPEGRCFAIDPAKVEADAQFDGIFVLRTNMKLSALAVVLLNHPLIFHESFQCGRIACPAITRRSSPGGATRTA